MDKFNYSGTGFYQMLGGGRAFIIGDMSQYGFEGDVCLMGFVINEPCKNVGWRKNGYYLNYPEDGNHSYNLLGKIHE